MKQNNKKALYESIMASVAREVKKALLTTSLNESCDWVGSGWEPSCTYQLVENHYHDKLTTENIIEHLNDLIDNYKWDGEWIEKEPLLNSENDIDKWASFKIDNNGNYRKYKYNTLEEYERDEYKSSRSLLPFNLWLKKKHDDWCKWDDRTNDEYYQEQYQQIQKDKLETYKYYKNEAKRYLNRSVDITEEKIRNIQLNKEIHFGSIAFGSGRETRSTEGYLKINEKTKPGKILYLEYTNKLKDALAINTVGDLFDLMFKYKETKIYTPVGVLNTNFANSINVRFSRDFKQGRLGILRFRG